MLETQVEELNRVLSERDDAYLRLRNEFEDARRKYEETAKIQADELDVLRSKAADATRLDALNVKLKAKMVSFNEMQDKIKQLEAAVSSTQGKSAEVDAEKAAVASLRAQLTESRSKLNEVEHALSQSSTSCAAKDAEIARLQRERTDWMKQRASLESQLVEATHAAAVAHDVESNHDLAAASETTALYVAGTRNTPMTPHRHTFNITFFYRLQKRAAGSRECRVRGGAGGSTATAGEVRAGPDGGTLLQRPGVAGAL
jgi:chromosome segregation ATPase